MPVPLDYAQRRALLQGQPPDPDARAQARALVQKLTQPHPPARVRKAAADALAVLNAEAATVEKAHPTWSRRQVQDAVAKSHPDVYETYRYALTKQDFPLTVPAPTTGYRDFTAMVEAYMQQHPGVSDDGARRAIMELEGGRAAYERHRQEMIFGRRS